MTVVDVLSHRLENEQETCRRQTELINELRLELTAFVGVQVRDAVAVICCCSRYSHACSSAKGRVAASPSFRLCEQMPIANAVDVRLMWFGLLFQASL